MEIIEVGSPHTWDAEPEVVLGAESGEGGTALCEHLCMLDGSSLPTPTPPPEAHGLGRETGVYQGYARHHIRVSQGSTGPGVGGVGCVSVLPSVPSLPVPAVCPFTPCLCRVSVTHSPFHPHWFPSLSPPSVLDLVDFIIWGLGTIPPPPGLLSSDPVLCPPPHPHSCVLLPALPLLSSILGSSPLPAYRPPPSRAPVPTGLWPTRTCGHMPQLPLLAQSLPPSSYIPSLSCSTLSSLWPCDPSPGEIPPSSAPPLNCSPVGLLMSTQEPHFSFLAMNLQGPVLLQTCLHAPGPLPPHPLDAHSHQAPLPTPQNVSYQVSQWPPHSQMQRSAPVSCTGPVPPSLLLPWLTQHQVPPPSQPCADPLKPICMTEGQPRAQALLTPTLSLLSHSHCYQ